jgi:hypothetical protein
MSAQPNSLPGPVLVPKRSLFAHVQEVEDIASLVDQLAGENELTPETAETLSAALCASIAGTKEKVDRTASVLAAFEAAEAAAIAERSRLDLRCRRFHLMTERLENYVLAVLTASNLDKIDGHTSTLARRKNPPKVVIDDESVIPWDFMRLPEVPPEPEAVPDKKLIAAALKVDPASVPGARLQPDNFRLVRS